MSAVSHQRTADEWQPIEDYIFENANGTCLKASITICGRTYVKIITLADYEGRGGRRKAITYLHRWIGSCRHAANRFSVDDDDTMPRYIPPRRYQSQYLLWNLTRSHA